MRLYMSIIVEDMDLKHFILPYCEKQKNENQVHKAEKVTPNQEHVNEQDTEERGIKKEE